MVNVLVVEDHSVFRNWLQCIVKSRFPSARVLAVDSAGEALGALDAFRPDVVIMDLRLPGLNGLEATRAMRARSCRAAIVMLTSCDLPEYRIAAQEAGAHGYLVKGDVNEQRIVELIASAAARTVRPAHERTRSLPPLPDPNGQRASPGCDTQRNRRTMQARRPVRD